MGMHEQTEAQLQQNETMRRQAQGFGQNKIGPESAATQLDGHLSDSEQEEGRGDEDDAAGDEFVDTGRDATRGAKLG